MENNQLKSAPLEWSKNLTLYEVNVRQYTKSGTFKEFEEHLPRLKELGVGIIWFMPIQPIGKLNRKGRLGSYYSISDYTAVNPEFGTLDEFKALVKKIQKMGMRVLLDWVANHTAWDHVWTKSNPDFYHKDENGNFKAPNPDWSDVIHLNYDNPELRKAMINDMKFWVEEAGIDGFRCDMAHLVVTDFWNQARAELDKVKPVFMLAESQNRDLLEKAFDMEYSWEFLHTADAIAQGKKKVYDLDHILENEITNYPHQNSYLLLFTSNHDENTWCGSAVERLGHALEAINLLTFTLPGMPLIYSGQEAGEWRRLSFFEKDKINWKEDKLFPFYQKLITLRQNNKALWSGPYGGDYYRINTSDNGTVFAFVRQNVRKKIFVVTNLCNYAQEITLYGDSSVKNGDSFIGKYTDYFIGKKIEIKKEDKIHLPAWGYKIFER